MVVLAKVVVFGQKLLYSVEMVVFGQDGCIRAKLVVLWQSGCIWAKVVLFENVVVFGQKWFYSG